MVEQRGTHDGREVGAARVFTTLDYLVDVTGHRAACVGRRTARVHLEAGKSVRIERRAVVEVKATIQRNAVELVSDLVGRAATDAELALTAVAGPAANRVPVHPGKGSHDTVLAVQRLGATGSTLRLADRGRVDRVQVAGDRLAHDASCCCRRDVAESFHRLPQLDVRGRR